MARSNPNRNIASLLSVVVAVVVIATLYLARVVLVPFALAMLLSFLLTPCVSFLERLRLPRVAAVLFVVALFVGAMGSVGWVVTNQLVDVTSQIPDYKANITTKIESLRSAKGQSLNKASATITELGKELAAAPTGDLPEEKPSAREPVSQAHPLPVEVVAPPTNLLDSARNVLGTLGTTGIVIVFAIFMLMRREDLRNRFIRLAGQGRLNVMTQALDEAATRVSRYVFLQFVVNACYGLAIGVALYFVGIPNALLWGVAAGILRFLPYVGPPIGAAMPILLSLAVFDGWTKALITIGLFVGLEIVVSNFVEPSLYGAHTGISALAILFAAVFWALLWGPIGLVLSTPLTVCVVVMARYMPHLGFLHVILGDEPVLPPEVQFYQRLLATDQNEARQVLETYLKDKPLEELYDCVLIPALTLAEQDRHRNELDEAAGEFIYQSIKELVEEMNDRSPEEAEPAREGEDEAAELPREKLSCPTAHVLCMPARDEADEIVGAMLAHLLERAGYRTHFLDIGTTTEMLARVTQERPTIVCLSALPPFAISHARRLHHALRAQSPTLKIVIGLWNSSGDPQQAANRIGGPGELPVSRTLAHAIQQIRFLSEVAPQGAAVETPAEVV